MAEQRFSLAGFSYRHFLWIGKGLAKIYSNQYAKLEETLETAGLKIFPDAYFSLVGFVLILAIIGTSIVVVVTRIYYLALFPLLIILLGYAIPKIKAYDRAAKLDMEVPFAGAYITVMATGGLSPYASIRKLQNCTLLPNLSKTVKDIEVDVQMKGFDPVKAMENSAEHLPSRDYRDLLLGYAHTLRMGGDVIHYLLVRTETMFRDLATKVKAFGERAAMLMEAYIAIIILSTLSLTIIYMTSIAFEGFWEGFFSADTFLLYAYLIVPGISLLFIYLADVSHFHEPIYEWAPYKVFAATSPLLIFLLLTMFLPFVTPENIPKFVPQVTDFVMLLRETLGLERGYEAAIGFIVTLTIGTVPAAIAHSYYLKRGKGHVHDVTNFLRDLTETRKTGASPERCIKNLSARKYGRFGKHLVTAARQISWGLPFIVIYETFKAKIKSWLALINLYLLVDAIEVGGGSPETLETLTRFSEMLSSLEKEKVAMLRPLLIMPYLGAGILLFTTIIFLQFMRFVLYSFGRQAMPFAQFATLFLPPIILQAYITGLVTGKVSSGTLSTGFKHAVILVVVALVLLLLSPYFTLPFTTWG